MEPTTTPGTPETASRPPRRRGRAILLAIGALIVVAFAVFILRSLWEKEEPVGPSADRPLDLPIQAPEITSLDEVAELTEGKPVPPAFPDLVLPPLTARDHLVGSQAAAISVVEYSNFGNSYAALLHGPLRELAEGSDGIVNWIVRDYPLNGTDIDAAQAAECAGVIGGEEGYWAYYDANFASAPSTADAVASASAAVSLDPARMKGCFESDSTNNYVLKDAQDGRLDANIVVSPSYVVANNLSGDVRLVEGVNTIEYIRKVIEAVK
jgi:hypothetical protein